MFLLLEKKSLNQTRWLSFSKESSKMAEYKTEIIFESDQKNKKLKSHEQATEKTKSVSKSEELKL